MKRLHCLLLGAITSIFAVHAYAASASNPSPGRMTDAVRSAALSGRAQSHEQHTLWVDIAQMRRMLAVRAPHSLRDGAAPTRVTGTDLRLPETPFTSPYLDDSGTIDSTHVVFKNAHPGGYSDLVSGYGEAATVGSVKFLYQGSIFGSAASAHAMYQDGVNTQGGAGSVQRDCSDIFASPCDIIVFTSTTNDTVLYQLIQVNYCLVESEAYAPESVVSANSHSITTILAQYTVDAVHLAQSVCVGSSPAPTLIPATATQTPTTPPTNTSLPTSTPAPTNTPPPTATPTQPAPTPQHRTVLDIRANGSRTTPVFKASRNWMLSWAVDCSKVGTKNGFAVVIYNQNGKRSRNSGFSRHSETARGTKHYTKGGHFYLGVNTKCSWHIQVLT